MFFGTWNNFFIDETIVPTTKKNCSNNKIRVDLFIEPILEQKHEI